MKYASPLFILREEAEKDLYGVLERLSAVGFEGVEFLGFFGEKPSDIKKKMDSLSMQAIGNHVGIDTFTKDVEKVIAEHLELGCTYITLSAPNGAKTPGSSDFYDIVSDIRLLSRKCVESGLTPLYHNHAHEFETDPFMLDAIIDACSSDGLRLEPDLGWMAVRQVDPAIYLRKYRHLCPVIHLKDIYSNSPDSFEFRPTGFGTVNYPALMPLCSACNPDWFVIDHDLAYKRNPYDDLRLSLEYVKNLLTLITT